MCIALLMAITQHFPDSTLQLHDSDGEVLLIEAALELPKWLEPDTSDNRVFVAGGKLQIVPPPSHAPGCVGLPPDPTLLQALAIVRASVLQGRGDAAGCAVAAETEASAAIQQVIRQRVAGYPAAAIKEARHRCFCHVPKSVAVLARRRPQLVSAAVRCFYQREPEDLKSAAAMKRFGKDQWVRTKVRFTKCLFAQMSKQQFFPPKGFVLPPKEDEQYFAHERGFKLAAAFEMLYHKDPSLAEEPACFLTAGGELPHPAAKDETKEAGAEGGSRVGDTRPAGAKRGSDGMPEGEAWENFLGALKKNGYFRGELEGSALFRALKVRSRVKLRIKTQRTHTNFG